MACRVGMTTDLEERKAYWKGRYSTLTNWQVLAGPISSKAAAQKKETELAEKYGCVSYEGGDKPKNPNASWYVYYFQH